jgi:hypothetical protein
VVKARVRIMAKKRAEKRAEKDFTNPLCTKLTLHNREDLDYNNS